ncbi:MAG: response regulator transcription factor [Deltaproteobacteria bacterium]|nr:response regulator transcription factor [Deltaproteobacteria bacterium]
MAKLRALIIHPSPEIRAKTRRLFYTAPEITILGEAVSSFEALELLEHIPYDVFLLGTELEGGVSGLELAQILNQRKQRPGLVFIAQEEQAAFKAFELGALDYLLWPFDGERIKTTIARIRRIVPDRPPVEGSRFSGSDGPFSEEETLHLALKDDDEDRLLSALRHAWDRKGGRPLDIEKLPITQDGRMYLIPYNQIVFVEAYEDYSYVHTTTQKYLTSYRLKNLEERLRAHRFFRVHRKYLVNLDMVTEIASMPGSNFMLRTVGRKKIELPVSRRRIGELKQLLML